MNKCMDYTVYWIGMIMIICNIGYRVNIVVQCYAPYKIIGYEIILPYFGQKNAKIIDPTTTTFFPFPSHTV